jgi:hypothetical protein
MSRQPTAAEQEAYLQTMRSQVAQQMAQELVNKMSENCFKVRIPLRVISPAVSLMFD